jgi:hypothetical protein
MLSRFGFRLTETCYSQFVRVLDACAVYHCICSRERWVLRSDLRGETSPRISEHSSTDTNNSRPLLLAQNGSREVQARRVAAQSSPLTAGALGCSSAPHPTWEVRSAATLALFKAVGHMRFSVIVDSWQLHSQFVLPKFVLRGHSQQRNRYNFHRQLGMSSLHIRGWIGWS